VKVVSGRERVRGPGCRGKEGALSRPHRCPSQDFDTRRRPHRNSPLVSMTLTSIAWSRRRFHPIRYRCPLVQTWKSSRPVSLQRLQSVVAFDNRASSTPAFLYFQYLNYAEVASYKPSCNSRTYVASPTRVHISFQRCSGHLLPALYQFSATRVREDRGIYIRTF
jgi:hypothetical protein